MMMVSELALNERLIYCSLCLYGGQGGSVARARTVQKIVEGGGTCCWYCLVGSWLSLYSYHVPVSVI